MMVTAMAANGRIGFKEKPGRVDGDSAEMAGAGGAVIGLGELAT